MPDSLNKPAPDPDEDYPDIASSSGATSPASSATDASGSACSPMSPTNPLQIISNPSNMDPSPGSPAVAFVSPDNNPASLPDGPTPTFPMRVYTFDPAVAAAALPGQPPIRAKRRQVKNACVNCQKSCKKCDDARPCLRCVKYGIGEECVDSQRKERRRGVKRGPYKKRDGNKPDGQSPVSDAGPSAVPSQGPPAGVGLPSPAAALPMPYIAHPGYGPAFYPQSPLPVGPPKPGEAAPAHVHAPQPVPQAAYYHPQYYVPVPYPPPPPHQAAPAPTADGQPPMGYPVTHFYPPPYVPYGSYAPPYMMPPPPGAAPVTSPQGGPPALHHGAHYVPYSHIPPPPHQHYARPPVLHPLQPGAPSPGNDNGSLVNGNPEIAGGNGGGSGGPAHDGRV